MQMIVFSADKKKLFWVTHLQFNAKGWLKPDFRYNSRREHTIMSCFQHYLSA